jgi:hypothetical protein
MSKSGRDQKVVKELRDKLDALKKKLNYDEHVKEHKADLRRRNAVPSNSDQRAKVVSQNQLRERMRYHVL